MKQAIRISILLIITLVAMALGCGMPGEPLPDDIYSRNIYPGDAGTYSVGSEDLPYEAGYFDNLYLDGANLLMPAYGEIYITTPIATTCALANTYYLVAGATTSDELKGFTTSNGRLTYTGTGERVCLIAAAISVSSDTANVVLGTKVYKNGVAHPASFIQRKLSVAGDAEAQVIATLVTLTANDYIEIYIATDTAAVNITFNCMSLTVTAID